MKLYQESNTNDFSDIEAQSFNQYFVTNIDQEYFQIHSSFLQASWFDIFEKVNTYLLNHNIEIETETNKYNVQKYHENAIIEIVKICLAVLLVFNKRYLVQQLKKIHVDYQKEIIKEIDEQVDEIRERISKNYLFYIRENKDKNELIKKLQEVMDKNTDLENALIKIDEEESTIEKEKQLLKTALEVKKNEIKEFNFEIKKLSEQLEKLTEDLINAQDQISQLNDQNKNLVKQKNKFYDKMLKTEQDYQDLLQTEQNFKKLVQRNQMLQNSLDEAQNQIERDKIKIDGYDQMVKNDNEMKQLLNSNNMTLKEYKEKQKSHIDQIMKYEKEIKEKNEYINHLETQNAVLERKYNDLDKDFKIYKSHAKAQVNDDTFSMDNFDMMKNFDITNPMGESYISEKLLQSTVVQEEVKKYQQKLKELQEDYDNLKQRQKKDIDELLLQIEQLQMKNYQLEEQSKQNNNINNIDNKDDDKQYIKQIKDLKNNIENLQNKKDKEIDDLKQQIQTKDQRIKVQDQNIINLQNMIKQPIKIPSISNLQVNTSSQEVQLVDNKDQVNDLLKQNQQSENALNKNRKTLLDYQQQQQELMDRINKLEEELKNQKILSKQRGDDMFYAQEQSKKFQKDLELKNQEQQNKEKIIKDLKEKISQFEQKLRELQRQLQSDESKSQLMKQIEDLKSQLNRQNDISNKTTEQQKQIQRQQEQINSLKNSLKVYDDKDQENEQYIKDLQKKIDQLNEYLKEAQNHVKVKQKTQYIIEEKYKPISQDEFDYEQIQLMYSTFMGYYTNHLKYDSYLLKRVQDTKKALTKNFSIGQLLNDQIIKIKFQYLQLDKIYNIIFYIILLKKNKVQII